VNIQQINEEIKKLPDTNGVSDGYHSFGELYDHRITLYIALCEMMQQVDWWEWGKDMPVIWRAMLHHDGTKYDGWFILGIGDKPGEQISYHLPIERWSETDFATTMVRAPKWDGHTPADVLERIKHLW
jgi:hypothetical protein